MAATQTPTEQTDEHSDEMLDAMAEEDCQDHDISHEKHQLPMLMEQGEEVMGQLLGIHSRREEP